MNPACFTDAFEGLTSRPRTSGGYVQTSGIFHQRGPSSIPIVAEIGVGLEVKMFTVMRMAHKWGAWRPSFLGPRQVLAVELAASDVSTSMQWRLTTPAREHRSFGHRSRPRSFTLKKEPQGGPIIVVALNGTESTKLLATCMPLLRPLSRSGIIAQMQMDHP